MLSRRMSLFLLRNLRNQKAKDFTSVISKSSSYDGPYRNRYTHFRQAYPTSTPLLYKVYGTFIFTAFLFFGAGGGLYLDDCLESYMNKKRKEKEEQRRNKVITAKCQSTIEDTETEEEPDAIEKTRVGFRDRKFIAYEDRIRAYSTPDKTFRYFATLKSVDNDTIYMTPDDFLRSITPGVRQPEGLDLDRFKRYDPKNESLELNIPKSSIFYRLCNKALLTFSDYIFLLTVLSTPRRQFELAFRMFDINGDGELDISEFEFVRSVITDTTAIGKRHRDHQTTGSTLKPNINSALQTYFFGPNGDGKLTITSFQQFQSDIIEEITRLEFSRMSPEDGKISAVSFANYLLTYAGFSEHKRRKMVRRVKQAFDDPKSDLGITYKEFADFNLLLRSISDVDTALTFYHMAGASIDKATLKHVASSVAGIKLSPFVIDVVFTLFDDNNDNQLSNREFVAVMRNRLLRGLDKPMDTGFVRFVDALCKCTKDQFHYKEAREPDRLGSNPAGSAIQ